MWKRLGVEFVGLQCWVVALWLLILNVGPGQQHGVEAYDCVFVEDMHFKSAGPYPHAPSIDKEHCCDLCHETPGCVAGIFAKDPGGEQDTCWFKDAATVTKANEEKRAGNTACISGEYATAEEKQEGTESDDGVGEWGQTFMKCAIGVSLAYLLGGIVYGRRARSDGQSSLLLQWHPHWRQWKDLAALVQDGVAFSLAAGHGVKRRRGYNEVSRSASVPSSSQAVKPDTEGRSPKREKSRKHNKAKHSSENRTQQEQKSSTRRDESTTDVSDGLAQEASASTGSPVGSTPSGGGGRWVHVST